jgi:phosphotransferase system IIA component
MDKSGSMLDTDLKTGDTIESVDLESVDKKNQKTFIECVESVTLENESSNEYNINKKKKTSTSKQLFQHQYSSPRNLA